MSDLTKEADLATENAALRAATVRLQRQLLAAKAKAEDLAEAVYRAAKDAAVLVGRPKLLPAPKHSAGAAESALLHATDWQVGKRTESYTTETAARRVTRLAEKVLYLTSIQRASRPINELHLLLGGDMVEGCQIFPGQAFEIDSTLYAQLFATATMIEGLVLQLASGFAKVHVWEASGNHGRLGRRGDYARADNADTILYRIVEERVRESTGGRAVWHRAPTWHQVIPIGAYRALLVHGDQVRGFGGNIPAYGIIKKVNAWAAGVLEPFTDAYLGHFHTHMSLPLANGRHAYVTGSLESGNEYAREFCGAFGTPSQRLHFIDMEKGRVVSEHPIYLD